MSVSVIICCYNGERYLRETFDSLFAQTLRPREIIVVDDGSTDGSGALAASYGELVRVVRQTNCGLPASRNVGIGRATGDYLFFIDVDDTIEPTSLERLAAAAGGRDDVVPIMGVEYFGDGALPDERVQRWEFDDFFPAIISGNFGPQHNRLVPRSLALRAGCFDPSMFLYEDWLFWCRVALCGARLVPVPLIGAKYRRHAETMSDTAPEIAPRRGHVRVMAELGEGVLARPALLEQWGDAMLWGAWTALSRGREARLPRSETEPLAQVVRRLARQGPARVRSSRLAQSINLLGVPLAGAVWKWAGRRGDSANRNAATLQLSS